MILLKDSKASVKSKVSNQFVDPKTFQPTPKPLLLKSEGLATATVFQSCDKCGISNIHKVHNKAVICTVCSHRYIL